MKTAKTILKEIEPILMLEFHDYKKKITENTTFRELKADKIKKKELLLQIEEFYQIKFREDLELHKLNDFIEYLIRVI